MALPTDNIAFWVGEIVGLVVFVLFVYSLKRLALSLWAQLFWIVAFWVGWTTLVTLAI
jgi:hypothetical protein